MPRGRGHGPRMSNEKAKDFKGTMKKLMAYLSAYKIGIFFVIVFAIGSMHSDRPVSAGFPRLPAYGPHPPAHSPESGSGNPGR